MALKWFKRKKVRGEDEPRGMLGLSVKRWVVWLVLTRIYAARCLPDEAFRPLWQMWREAVEAGNQLHPEHPGIKNTLKRTEVYGQMPQTPLDAPL